MIAPHELKNKTFSKSVRGYNPAEVDQYFDFLIEKYTEAFKAATEFEQRYNQIQAKYAEISGEEDLIRQTLLDAQKLRESIVNKAKMSAAEKEAELSSRCDQIIAEAKEKVQAEKENIVILRKTAAEFQHKLYNEYLKHLETIQSLNLEELQTPDALFDEDKKFEEAKDKVINGDDISVITDSTSEGESSETI